MCSNTVWIGHLGKNTAKEQIQEAFDEFGPVKSIDVRLVVLNYSCHSLLQNWEDKNVISQCVLVNIACVSTRVCLRCHGESKRCS